MHLALLEMSGLLSGFLIFSSVFWAWPRAIADICLESHKAKAGVHPRPQLWVLGFRNLHALTLMAKAVGV